MEWYKSPGSNVLLSTEMLLQVATIVRRVKAHVSIDNCELSCHTNSPLVLRLSGPIRHKDSDEDTEGRRTDVTIILAPRIRNTDTPHVVDKLVKRASRRRGIPLTPLVTNTVDITQAVLEASE